MTVVLNVLLIVVVAFAARALLDARQVSLTRLLVASLLGWVVGWVAAVLLLLGPDGLSSASIAEDAFEENWLLVATIQVLFAMGLVVGFELVSSRPRRRFRLRPVNPFAAVRRRLAIMRRGAQVARIGAQNNIGPRLSRRHDDGGALDRGRELRTTIEQLGGVYTKLGQVLATRPDLLPPETIDELGKLQSSAAPLPIEDVRAVLEAELGDRAAALRDLDPVPLGSASIAQVHTVRLQDGRRVVVKVQRPGLELAVERDLAILDWVARGAERRGLVPPQLRVRDLVEEFADALREELDFRNEAHRAESVAAAVARWPLVRVPEVLEEYTTPRVLVMELLEGRPLSSYRDDEPVPGGKELADALADSQITSMFRGERFHGDAHPGNVLVLDDGRLGLIDLGMTGRLDSYGQTFVVQLLAAVHQRNAELLYESLLTAGSVDAAADRDRVERAIAGFLASYDTPDLLSPGAMTQMMRVMTSLGIALPPQAATMLRALATLLGTLDRLSPGYPSLQRITSLVGGMPSTSSVRAAKDVMERELLGLVPVLRRLPRHVDRIATQLEGGNVVVRVSLFSRDQDVQVVERLVSRSLLALLGLGLGGLSVALLNSQVGMQILEDGVYFTQVLGWVGLFCSTALILRSLLDALRRR